MFYEILFKNICNELELAKHIVIKQNFIIS